MTNKTARLHVRFSELEKTALQRQADMAGMTMSDYIRMLVINNLHPVSISNDDFDKIEDAIRFIGGWAKANPGHPDLDSFLAIRSTLIGLVK